MIIEKQYSVKSNKEDNFSLAEYSRLKFPGKVIWINKDETAEDGKFCQTFSIDGTIIDMIYNRLKRTFAKIRGEPERVRKFHQLLEKILGAKLEEIQNGEEN